MDIKKAWNPTIAVPRSEAFALPGILKTATRTHADIREVVPVANATLFLYAHWHKEKRHNKTHTHIGHSSLQCSKNTLKVANFQIIRTERQINALIMSATPPSEQTKK